MLFLNGANCFCVVGCERGDIGMEQPKRKCARIPLIKVFCRDFFFEPKHFPMTMG